MRFLVTLIFASFICAPAAAQDSGLLEFLSGKTLSDSFVGKTMAGTYKRPREKTGTALFTESYYADGTTYYREGDISDEGVWNIYGDQICFEYKGELAGAPSCFHVFVSGTCYYAYHPRNVRNGKPISRNAWSVKTLTRGTESTCDNLVS